MIDFWFGKRVLVTGATGFLGGWLSQKLVEKGARVIGTSQKGDFSRLKEHGIAEKMLLEKLDITSKHEIDSFFDRIKPEYCFHAAGIALPSLAEQDSLRTFEINVKGTELVARACARYRTKLIAISSVGVYGTPFPVSEEATLNPKGVYAETKKKMEEVIREIATKENAQIIIVRATNMYGPLNPNERIPFISNNILAAFEKKQLNNTPHYLRDFIYVEDAAEGCLALAQLDDSIPGEIFNLCTGEAYEGEDIVRAIHDILENRHVSLTVTASQPSNAKILSRTSWRPRHRMEDGLRKTIEGYRSRFPRATIGDSTPTQAKKDDGVITSQAGLFSYYLREKRNSLGASYVKGHRVLDAGCNTGYIRKFLPSNIEYVGIDVRPPIQPSMGFTYFQRGVTDNLDDLGYFDSIILLATIEHLSDHEKVIGNLSKRLNEGGRLIVTTPTILGDKIHGWGSQIGLVSPDAAEEHEKIFTLEELRTVMKDAGLEVEDARTFLLGLNQIIVGKKPTKKNLSELPNKT